MLTFRRALITAFIFVTLFLLLRSSHREPLGDSDFRIPTEGPFRNNDLAKQAATPTGVEEAAPAIHGSSATGIAHAPNNQQLVLSDISKKPLRQQLEYYFPYSLHEKFPAYIWQTWKETPASVTFPKEWRPFEASWTELHPGFVHEVITDKVVVHVLRHLYSALPEVLEAYDALPHPVLKADFFRYLILLARGGIYTDIDTAAIKSAIDWVPASVPRSSYGLVIGIEADPDREDWRDWYARRIQFCQWTIQAKPGHPVLLEMVARVTEETLRRKREGSLSNFDLKGTMEFTGPAAWTDIVFEYFNNPTYFDMGDGKSANISWQHLTGIDAPRKIGDVVILPITSFSPGIQQMGAKEPDDPMAFVLHNFEGSWKPEAERHMGEKAQARLKAQQEELEAKQKALEAKQKAEKEGKSGSSADAQPEPPQEQSVQKPQHGAGRKQVQQQQRQVQGGQQGQALRRR